MNWSEKSALRWDCAKRGCNNIHGRPKLLAFADDLPGRISFSDIDGVVEIGGRLLFLEWKGPGAQLHVAQEILHKNLTALSPRIVSVVVEGDAAAMTCARLRVIRRGVIGPWEPCTLEILKGRIRRWADAASARRRAAA